MIAGEQWAPTNYFVNTHKHEVWEIYLQLDGHCGWDINGEIVDLKENDFLAVSPHVSHKMSKAPPREHHFVFVAFDPSKTEVLYNNYWTEFAKNDFFTIQNAEKLVEPFRYLIREIITDSEFKKEGIETALRSLLLEITRYKFRKSTEKLEFIRNGAVSQCVEIIDKHPEQNWNLKNLGKLSGYSPNHIMELFRSSLGITPHQYIIKKRLENSKYRLKNTTQSITDIALDLGFHSSQHFSNTFKKHYEISPRQYRNDKQAFD